MKKHKKVGEEFLKKILNLDDCIFCAKEENKNIIEFQPLLTKVILSPDLHIDSLRLFMKDTRLMLNRG